MKRVPRIGNPALVLVLAVTFGASPVWAQPTVPRPSWSCGDTVTLRPYTTCPLLLDETGVRRGDDWRLIARAGLYRPMPLSVIFSGDSARQYALRYEHDMRIAGWMTLAGRGMLLGTTAVLLSCAWRGNACSGPPNSSAMPYTASASALAAGSVALLVIQHRYRERAWWWAGEALWWHNRGVPRH